MSNENKVTLQLPRIKGWEFTKIGRMTPGSRYLPLEIAVAIVERHGDIEHNPPVLFAAYKANDDSWVALYEPQKVLQPCTMVWHPKEDYPMVPAGSWVISRTSKSDMTHVFAKAENRQYLPYGEVFAILEQPTQPKETSK